MRALIVFAHPCEDSFSAALHSTVLETLHQRKWEVDDCDLYKENFSPVLTPHERQIYHDEPSNIEPVKEYVERLRAAEALILVFPVWIFGFPAILKGFFDRVCVPGVAFTIEDGKLSPNLTQIRKLAAITTYGGTRFRALAAGDPPRRVVKRAIRFYCQPSKLRYLALYNMNCVNESQRKQFLHRIQNEMSVF